MSRLHDFDDRPDRVELRDLTGRPSRCELADELDFVEPADFDDVRLAERFGVQPGGFFAFENGPVEDYGLEDPF